MVRKTRLRFTRSVSYTHLDVYKRQVYGYSMAGDDYYEAVCNWMKRRHQLDINADNIVTTTGVVTALKIAVNAFTAPGLSLIHI